MRIGRTQNWYCIESRWSNIADRKRFNAAQPLLGLNVGSRLLAAVCRQTRETNSPVSTDNRTHSSLEPHSALLFIERCGCRIFHVVVQQMNFTNDVLDQRRHSA